MEQPAKAVCTSVLCFPLRNQQRALSPSQLSITAPLCARAAVSISAFLYISSALRCWPCSVPSASSHIGGVWLLVLNIIVPQHPRGRPEAHSTTQRHVSALVPLDPGEPLPCVSPSWTRSVSLSISLHSAALLGGQLESKTSLPAHRDGEAPLLPRCRYFLPKVTNKLLWVFKWAVISSFHQHSLTLDSQCSFSFNEFIGMTRYTGDAKVDNLIHQVLLSCSRLHSSVTPLLFPPPQRSFLPVCLCLSVCLSLSPSFSL